MSIDLFNSKQRRNGEHMSISFDRNQKCFLLQTEHATYVIKLVLDKYLSHAYWGNKITNPDVSQITQSCGRVSTSSNPTDDWTFSLDTMQAEYPSYGQDLRSPAYQIQLINGTRFTDLSYQSYNILTGKPALQGLPAVYANSDDEAETLEITMTDNLIGLEVVLSYSIINGYDVIIRSTRFINHGTENLKLLRALSMSMDLPHFDYDLLTLSGSWARERHMIRRPLVHGTQSIESRRGTSGHCENPFLALLDKNTTEHSGEAFGFSLVYSGSYLASVDVEQYGTARVSLGINPFDFSWLLEPSESFTTPEVVAVYSKHGLNGMSAIYHDLYRNHLARGKYRNAVRPIVINNWEATYFDFDEEKLIQIAGEASKLGIEMLVLDDGWFGVRNNDNCSLGDWYVNLDKLPHGLKGLSDAVNSFGMKFGLWMEPEMVSPDSDLYRAHPDWCLHVPDYHRTTARQQLILDYSRTDVQEYIIEIITNVLQSASISYVKWDMNRNMSEIGSALLPPARQMETAHRYILGVYHVMDTIVTAFPDILFESCAGGGGRFDPGILYYMPQGWTSDDTDGVERLKIQYGTSMVYPASCMTAHVSASPNHQTGRKTSLSFRGNVAMSGNFGYELNVAAMSDDEKALVKQQVALYKEIRPIIQYGDLHRLLSPFDSNITAWLYVTLDKKDAVVFIYRVLNTPNDALHHIRLAGLDALLTYQIQETSAVLSGEQLMNYGINLLGNGMEFRSDFESVMLRLKCIE